MFSDDGSSVRLGSVVAEGATERHEVTLRLLVIADLAPEYDGGPLSVDRESFDSVLERLAPHVELDVPDCVGSGRKSFACRFDVKSLDRLHPDGIVEAVPILRGLVEARELLGKCLAREVELSDVQDRVVAAFSGTDLGDSFRKKAEFGLAGEIAGAEASPDDGGAGAVNSILDKVDVPEAASGAPTATDLVEMMAAVIVPTTKPIDRSLLEGVIEQIDDRLSRQVAAIQKQPAFRKLETAWLGLKFLVDRLDFRGPTRLEVLPSGRAEVVQRFFDQVFHEEYEGRSEVSLSFVLVDHSLGRSVPDLETVRDMARMGESLNVPFVAAMDPSYWGVRQARLVTKLPDLMQKAKGSEYAKWNRFRSEPTSHWVALVANRFLLRSAWAEARMPPKRFSWGLSIDAEEPTWGSAVWALGVVLGQSFAEAGITFPCVGPDSAGALRDLPVLMRQEGSSEPHASTLEIEFTDERAFQLAQVGFTPLISQIGTDQAYFNLVPMFHQPARYEDQEATRSSFLTATLPYRGFAGAVANHLDRLGRAIGAGVSPDDVAVKVRDSLLAILAPLEEEQSPESVEAEVEANSDHPELLDVTVRLRPGFRVYGGPVDLIIGTSIPR